MNSVSFQVQPSEHWWGGRTCDGVRLPFSANSNHRCDLNDNGYNQAAPFFVSSKGRWLWSDAPFELIATDGTVTCAGESEIQIYDDNRTLRAAFQHARRKFVPPPRAMPSDSLFRSPQYNTWIELVYKQEELAILTYAERLIAEGYPPGVLMIDDNWQEDYGVWDFHPRRFRNPKAMIDRLHQLGFEVMLWICPFVSPDSAQYRALRQLGALVLADDAKPHMSEWWNGRSAAIDLTHDAGRGWFDAQLRFLCDGYGIDGFKFDAGDFAFYPRQPHAHCEAFDRVGCKYPLNEYRAAWKCADLPLAQRLADRRHSWGEDGLASVIPNLIMQGLLGYPFVCPDMIGGGEYQSFSADGFAVDEELIVRYAWAAALCPMMQFSVAPWRVLSKENAAICRQAALLHASLGEETVQIAKASAESGDPMLRCLEYQYPGNGYELVRDQFMLGDDILVAPVLKKGQSTRPVIIPPGRWQDDRGMEHLGPTTTTLDAPIDRLIWMRRCGDDQ